MAKMALSVWTHQDRTHVVMRLDEDGKTVADILLDGPAADRHIRRVAGARGELTDEIPRSLTAGAGLETVADPVWRTAKPAQGEFDGVAVALRHPGLGWLSFALSPAEARALAVSLIQRAEPGSAEAPDVQAGRGAETS